jgi:hypothetical protein
MEVEVRVGHNSALYRHGMCSAVTRTLGVREGQRAPCRLSEVGVDARERKWKRVSYERLTRHVA